MAAIPGFRFDITGASGSQGLLGPKSSWRAYVLPRGGYASQASSGTTITFDSAAVASRFANNNWVQVALNTANIRRVTGVGGNSITVTSAITVAENDRVYLIGNTEPTVSGGSATYGTPDTVIRQRDDDAADLYTNSMITTDSNGLVQGYGSAGIYDVLVQDGNQANQGSIIEMAVGISSDYHAFFGTTLTVHGALGVTGWATFGSTVTMNAAIGVTGWATFGSTVTMNSTLGVTGTVTFGSTVTVNANLTVPSNTGIFARLGAASSAQSGGAIRFAHAFTSGSTTGGIQEALNDLPSIGGIVIVSPGVTTTATGRITVPADTTLAVLGSLVVSEPIRMSQYSRIVGNGMMAANSRILAAANTGFTSLIRGVTQNGQQEGFYVEDITLNGNRSGTTTSFSVGVLDISGCFVPSTFRNLLFENYVGAPGIYGINGTSDGGGPLTIDNIWLNPGSNSGGIMLEHDATNAVYMHGYWLRNLTIELFGTSTGIEFKNSHADRYLQRIHVENVFLNTTGSSGTGILFDGVANSTVKNVIGEVPGGDVVRLTSNALNTGIALDHVIRTNGVRTVNDFLNGYSTSSNVTRYITVAAEDYVDFSRGSIYQIPVLTTASLPVAGTTQNGRIVIEDGGAGNGNLVIYNGGQRFRIDGGVTF